MKNALRIVSVIACVVAATSVSASAAVIDFTFGQQDFNDGDTMISVLAFEAAGMGEGSPFEAFIGSDPAGPSFSLDLPLLYDVILDPIVSATIAFGIFDHDSAAPGSQVSSFSVDGADLTSALDALFEAGGGAASGQYKVYSLALPVVALADGSAMFSLALSGPGLGILGPTTSNGAGLDFITLSIETETTAPTPEPGATLLLFLAVASLVTRGQRRRS